MQNTENFIRKWIADGYAGDVAVAIGNRGGETYRYFCSDRGEVLNGKTLFDMMSVSKILTVAPLVQIAIEEGKITADDRLGDYFPEAPDDKADIPLWMLLSHCSGILRHDFPEYATGERHGEVAKFILSFPLAFTPGSKYVYSCGNFILLGFLLERVFNKPLDLLADDRIFRPLGMKNTGFLPAEDENIVRSTRSAYEGRNKCSDIENRRLYGVSGNAGIFSCIDDMSVFGRSLLCEHKTLMKPETFAYARHDYAKDLEMGRSLGYVYVDRRYAQAGGLYSDGAVGHTGFSGTECFADFANDLYVVSLTNTAYYAVLTTGDPSNKTAMFRTGLHNALALDLGIK